MFVFSPSLLIGVYFGDENCSPGRLTSLAPFKCPGMLAESERLREKGILGVLPFIKCLSEDI